MQPHAWPLRAHANPCKPLLRTLRCPPLQRRVKVLELQADHAKERELLALQEAAREVRVGALVCMHACMHA